MKKPLVIIAGPTAVGKTQTSIQLAKRINGEIISADSMQIYKGMDIGTAKITEKEMEGIPHYLIDELYPQNEFSVATFKAMAKKRVDEIHEKGKIPILVGGTGFYIQSLIYDIDFTEQDHDKTYRKSLEEIAEAQGSDVLHEMLKEVDSESATTIHKNNVKRVIRALEYFHQTGEPISEHNQREREKESPYNVCFFVLTMDRKALYERIDQRVDLMVKSGLVEEVKGLLDEGYSKDLVSMQGLGYKEFMPYFEGEISLEEAVYVLKRDTRHFAKRQFTWFKREKLVDWLDVDDYDRDINKIVENIVNKLVKSKILL